MAKDPAFLFYSSDFLTGTILFSHEQKGKYITLLCLQHQKGHLSEKDIISICSAYDEDVLSKFKKDDTGLYYNERLEEEIKRRKNYTDSRKANAQHPKKQRVKKSKAYAKHMENENEIENTIEIIIKEGIKNVKINPKEYNTLCNDYTKDISDKAIIYLSGYKTEKGYKTKSDYLTIRRWVIDAVKKQVNGAHKQTTHGSKQAGAHQLLASIKNEFAARGKSDYGE
jgi:uncharacterized protein YdaU (DUF1376 family)